MPGKLNFAKMATEGITKIVRLGGAASDASPDTGRRWMILSGVVYHDGAVVTFLGVTPKQAAEGAAGDFYMPLITIAALSAAGNTALFTTFPDSGDADHAHDQQIAWHPIIIEDDEKLIMTGGATCKARIKVLEW